MRDLVTEKTSQTAGGGLCYREKRPLLTKQDPISAGTGSQLSQMDLHQESLNLRVASWDHRRLKRPLRLLSLSTPMDRN